MILPPIFPSVSQQPCILQKYPTPFHLVPMMKFPPFPRRVASQVKMMEAQDGAKVYKKPRGATQPHKECQRTLLTTETDVLSLGTNFATPPRAVPPADIIQATEPTIRKRDKTTADNIRVKIYQALLHAKPIKSNLTRPEVEALCDLCSDKSIHTITADKGNATVVMDRVAYSNKVQDILTSGTYRPLPKDPTQAIEKCITSHLLALLHSDSIPGDLYHRSGSPTYETIHFLTGFLQPRVGNTPHHISNSTQLVKLMRNLSLQPTDIMIADLIGLCVPSSYFKFQDQFYEQTAGTSMGSPISPVLANIFMEEFETSSLLTADLKPTIWLHYVDNTFIIWSHGQDHLQEFLKYLNKQHPTIKFTMEQEQDGYLSFLDVHLFRNPDGTLNHRKPTHTDWNLHQKSFHHPAIKTSVNRTLVRRAYEICDQNNLHQELHHCKSTLKMNGYRNQCNNLSKPSPRMLGSPIPEVPPSPMALGSPIPEAPQTPTATVCLLYLGPTSH
ncbi:uncharacterized protein LOC110986851 [Acanthaster planci]|uniref:Uncharacterized protein LOC110986851 n=1 Tax=Acanthaster planci TaxID=133434 RepID=A0A8B7ZN46_ACAPL|nr:uncharacterized protein LOC110986851 [Acanthaster planci]